MISALRFGANTSSTRSISPSPSIASTNSFHTAPSISRSPKRAIEVSLSKLYRGFKKSPLEIGDQILSPRKELFKIILAEQTTQTNTTSATQLASHSPLAWLIHKLFSPPTKSQNVDIYQAFKINLLTRHSTNHNSENNLFLKQSLLKGHMPLFNALLRTTEMPDLSPLIEIAALKGDQVTFKKLLSKVHGPLPKQTLQQVANCGQPEMLKQLWKAGTETSPTPETLIERAEQQKARREQLQLLSQSEKNKQIFERVSLGIPATHDISEVIALVQAGANINLTDKNGKTLLNTAAMWGRNQFVTILIQAGADINQADRQGQTPLIEAAIKSQIAISNRYKEEIANELIQACTHIKHVNNALFIAGAIGDNEIVAALIQAGADVNQTDAKGKTPLHVASKNGDTEIVNTLIQAGADVNHRDTLGETPLKRAKRSNTVELLKAHGAVE